MSAEKRVSKVAQGFVGATYGAGSLQQVFAAHRPVFGVDVGRVDPGAAIYEAPEAALDEDAVVAGVAVHPVVVLAAV